MANPRGRRRTDAERKAMSEKSKAAKTRTVKPCVDKTPHDSHDWTDPKKGSHHRCRGVAQPTFREVKRCRSPRPHPEHIWPPQAATRYKCPGVQGLRRMS